MVHLERYSSSYHRHTDLRVCLRPFSDFVNEHPQYVAQSNAMNFLSNDAGAEYNLCHCTSIFLSSPRSKERALNYDVANQLVWSNFEIADMDFWRGDAYTTYFEYLDSHGGFYYEVQLQSASTSLVLPKKSNAKS